MAAIADGRYIEHGLSVQFVGCLCNILYSIKRLGDLSHIFTVSEPRMSHRVTGVLLLAVVLLMGCQNSSEIAHISADTDQAAAVETSYHNEYGIPTDSVWAFTGEISYGETLADILYEFDVSSQKIAELREASEGVFNVRRLRAGHSYRIYRARGAEQEVQYVVYEPNATSYVVFELTEPVSVTIENRSVETVGRAVAGVIGNSLYQTLQDAGAPPILALEMSEVYAWQIDFYGIQQGDRFKVIYEQELVDGHPVGIGNVLGAYFEHRDEAFYAIRFQQGEDTDYFDIDGRSLRKAFLKAPLEYSRISSGFSRRRFHPVQNRYKPHLGTDYAAPRGTPIRSTGDGTVIAASYSSGNGRYVKVRHNGTYTTGYLHMSKIAEGVRDGTRVDQGEVIGYVGATGLATGPHLHYSFWKNGQAIDPLEVEMPPSEPVNDEYANQFEQKKMAVTEALAQITYPENRRLRASFAALLGEN